MVLLNAGEIVIVKKTQKKSKLPCLHHGLAAVVNPGEEVKSWRRDEDAAEVQIAGLRGAMCVARGPTTRQRERARACTVSQSAD